MGMPTRYQDNIKALIIKAIWNGLNGKMARPIEQRGQLLEGSKHMRELNPKKKKKDNGKRMGYLIEGVGKTY